MKAAWFSGRGARIAICASAVSSLAYIHNRRIHNISDGEKRFKEVASLPLSPTLIEGIAGAVGEVMQMVLLYPLDTIKVRCQALGQSSSAVVKQLLQTSKGIAALLKSFYAGCMGAALCSIPIGAVHFASFETSKRLLMGAMTCGEDASKQLGSDDDAVNLKNRRLMANIIAAAIAAIATAVIESPVELFRHNQQASTAGTSFMTEMSIVMRTSGLPGLYWGFLPHCFESLPHDTAELIVYGALMDWQADSLQKSSPETQWIRDWSNGPGFDLFVGGAAGAASVLVSMPFDSVKTYLQTHGSCELSKTKGVMESAFLFLSMGKEMVRSRGFSSLYSGIFPRLLQRVPSAMLNWMVISYVSRFLQGLDHEKPSCI